MKRPNGAMLVPWYKGRPQTEEGADQMRAPTEKWAGYRTLGTSFASCYLFYYSSMFCRLSMINCCSSCTICATEEKKKSRNI